MLKALCRISSNDIRSVTGRNLKAIREETGILVKAGVTSPWEISNWRVYTPGEGEEWRLPLVVSLLEIRNNNWELKFNEEKETLDDEDIVAILNDVCTGS